MSLLFYNRAEGKGEFYRITDGKATLQLLGSQTGWRKTWTHLVDCTIPSLLFYDAAGGMAEFYSLGQYNAEMQLLSSTTISKGWTHIVWLGQELDSGYPSNVLFYNASNGLAQFYLIDAQASMHLQTNTTFSQGWTHIEPFAFAHSGTLGLLFYNRSNGLTQVYTSDGHSLTQQVFNSTFSSGWTHVVASATPLLGDPTVLFYDSTSGAARYTVINDQGNVSQVASTSYAAGWTHIIPGGFDGENGVIIAFLFYNATTGTAQFYQLNKPGSITQLSNTTFAKGWSEILWLALPLDV